MQVRDTWIHLVSFYRATTYLLGWKCYLYPFDTSAGLTDSQEYDGNNGEELEKDEGTRNEK